MKEITLSNGGFALVSDQDYDKVKPYRWFLVKKAHVNVSYAAANIIFDGKRRQVRMHRFILDVYDTVLLVDHKDHNGLNNQRENLRIATAAQNSQNRRPQKKAVSKYLGVFYRKDVKSWFAAIKLNGTNKTLGYFKNEIDAAKKYNEAALQAYGEFANLNSV